MSSSLLSPSQASQVTLGGTVSQWPSRKCIFTAFFSGTGVRAVRRITYKRAGRGVHLSLGDIPFGGGGLGHLGSLEHRVAEVAREHGWHPPKSLDSDENFKPEHTLFCRELRFVAIYALFFGDLWA